MSVKDYTPLRRDLHEAISDAIRANEANVLGVTGWVLIAETSTPHGRDLLAISGDVVGDNDIPHWTLRGWLAEILDDIFIYFGPEQEEED